MTAPSGNRNGFTASALHEPKIGATAPGWLPRANQSSNIRCDALSPAGPKQKKQTQKATTDSQAAHDGIGLGNELRNGRWSGQFRGDLVGDRLDAAPELIAQRFAVRHRP